MSYTTSTVYRSNAGPSSIYPKKSRENDCMTWPRVIACICHKWADTSFLGTLEDGRVRYAANDFSLPREELRRMKTKADRLNRRSFLTQSTTALGALGLLPSRSVSAAGADGDPSPQADLHLYCDESGILGQDVLFVLGMLVTTDTAKHESFIGRLREDHRFATQLRYSSTDRFKEPFARDLINYFFSEPDLQFCAYVIMDTAVANLRKQGYSLEQVYHLYYELLISNCTAPEAAKTLNLEIRNSIGDDQALRRHLRENVVNLSRINVIGSASSDLLQIADLFAGCIYGDVHNDTLRSRVKRDVLNLLKARLNVDSLLDARLSNPRGPFRVFVF
jgi:hypothetical protein